MEMNDFKIKLWDEDWNLVGEWTNEFPDFEVLTLPVYNIDCIYHDGRVWSGRVVQ
jgi:hypothetical protein